MADVVDDGEDASQNVTDPAYYEDCIESECRDWMFRSESIGDVDRRILFLEENNSPNR